MCTKMKGFYKGVKYLSQILVVKERQMELEIGYPTDVQHVAHIGADGVGGATPPSWMNGFRNGPDFSANSTVGSLKEKKSTSSNGTKQSSSKADSATDLKKNRRKKPKSSISCQKHPPDQRASNRPKQYKGEILSRGIF